MTDIKIKNNNVVQLNVLKTKLTKYDKSDFNDETKKQIEEIVLSIHEILTVTLPSAYLGITMEISDTMTLKLGANYINTLRGVVKNEIRYNIFVTNEEPDFIPFKGWTLLDTVDNKNTFGVYGVIPLSTKNINNSNIIPFKNKTQQYH